ncbi:MAG: putative DNA binding domain-containing protein [Treponema sp.]|nr:putative DNA binding domain-containing protein [Treponema sp.]
MRSIPEKETLFLEFKSDRKKLSDSELLDEVVGFANTDGGKIYVGVEDDGEVTGVCREHEDAVGVSALISNKTVPSVYVQAEVIQEETEKGLLPVLVISVPQSKSIVATTGGKIMRRRLKLNGSPEVVPMYPHEISTRLSELRLLDYSAQVLAGSSMDDFDSLELARLRNLIENNPKSDRSLVDLDDEEMEKSLHLISRNDSGLYLPTIAGMLLIGKKEKIRELIPTAKAEFQILTGTTVRVNEEMAESILATVERFETYLEAWNPELEFENGMYRVGIPEFDRDAFREALVNAFCHRDYTQLGAVRVLIDDEGLSITSPGSFVDGVSSQNILTVEPHGRNPMLADILKRVGLAEKTGRGIDRIFEGQIIYGRKWPDYSESTSRYVRVYLQRSRPDFEFFKMIKDTERQVGKSLTINQLLILSLLKNGGKYSAEEIRLKTGITESRFDFSIRRLKELGLVLLEGSGAKSKIRLGIDLGHSRLKGVEYYLHASRVLSPEDDFKLVAYAAKRNGGVISKEEISRELGITNSQAYSLITQYVEEGKMRLVQSGRYAKYQVMGS